MAFSRLLKAAAAFALVSSIQSVAADDSSSSDSICASSSECVPFIIDLTWGPTDPSKGPSRNAILTNGSLPGPPLKLKVGDCVDFVVNNNLKDVTGVHFHGIRQNGTPWADGVPGVNQYSIKPGTSFMYQWTAEESGSYFYHAHYKGQMMDGLYGAILIAPADDATTPFSQISADDEDLLEAAYEKMEPIFASDWNLFTFSEFFAAEQAANVDIACSDSIVLNGFGSIYCPSVATFTANASPITPQILNGTSLTAKGCIPPTNPLIQGPQYQRNVAALPPGAYDVCSQYGGKNYTYQVNPADGWAAITFISPAPIADFRVTIDSHKLYVFEVNGNFIVPQVVDQVGVSNGDRVSVFVKLDQTPGDYTIRVANSGINQVISGFGVLSYKGGNNVPQGVSVMNLGGINTTAIVPLNKARAAPFPPQQIPQSADVSYLLTLEKSPSQPTDSWAWTLSGVESYDQSRDDEVPPLLFQDPANIPESDLILTTETDQWIDLIMIIPGPLAQPHPIHKHANKFYVIGAGTGPFNFTNVDDAITAGLPFNLVNPPFVDGFTSPPAQGTNAWMVFRYQANTPGAWLLHCHIQSHFSGGMAVAILDGVDNFPIVPSDVGQVCPGSGSSNYPGCNGTAPWADWGSSSTSTPSGPVSTSTKSGSWGSSSTPVGPATTSSGSWGSSSTPVGPATTSSGSWNPGKPSGTVPVPIATYTGAASDLKTPTAAFGLLAALALFL